MQFCTSPELHDLLSLHHRPSFMLLEFTYSPVKLMPIAVIVLMLHIPHRSFKLSECYFPQIPRTLLETKLDLSYNILLFHVSWFSKIPRKEFMPTAIFSLLSIQLYPSDVKKYRKFEHNIEKFLLVCKICRFAFVLNIFLKYYKSFVIAEIRTSLKCKRCEDGNKVKERRQFLRNCAVCLKLILLNINT